MHLYQQLYINCHSRTVFSADATPVPGIPVRPPLVQPQPGQIITHYEVYSPKVSAVASSSFSSPAPIAPSSTVSLRKPECIFAVFFQEPSAPTVLCLRQILPEIAL